MIFNGKELRVLSGAIIVFQNIPISQTIKRKILQTEDECLEYLFDRIMSVAEAEYKKIGAESLADVTIENLSGNEKIRKRLSVIVDISLSSIELRLIKEALTAYITEAEARNDEESMNAYYSGGIYGLNIEDFQILLERIKAGISCD